MSADNSCGDRQWVYERKNLFPGTPYERPGIDDRAIMEIERLNHEIMKMKVYIQGLELDALGERHFREMHPSVQDAWDQYQTVLRLAKK